MTTPNQLIEFIQDISNKNNCDVRYTFNSRFDCHFFTLIHRNTKKEAAFIVNGIELIRLPDVLNIVNPRLQGAIWRVE